MFRVFVTSRSSCSNKIFYTGTAEAELASLRELANRPSDASVEVRRRMKELMHAVEVRDRELRDMRALMIEANSALKQGRKELRRSKRRERRALNRMTNELIVDSTKTTNISSGVVKKNKVSDDGNRDVPLRASDLTNGNIENEIQQLRDMKSKLSSSTSQLYDRREKKSEEFKKYLSRSQEVTTTSKIQEEVPLEDPLRHRTFSLSELGPTTSNVRIQEEVPLEDPLRHHSFSSSELGPTEPSTRRQSDESFEMTVYYTASIGETRGAVSGPPPGLDDV